jgi:ComF family protein
MREQIVNFIYPKRCPICDGIIVQKEAKICENCREKLTYVKEPRCKKCGKEILNCETEYCYDCLRKKHLFDEGAALFEHNKIIKESIYRFKYNNKREYADFYAEEISRHFKNKIIRWDADVLIPVPLHNAKKIKRGFNQAEVLAEKLVKFLKIEVDSDFLIRVRKTNAQKELSKKDRAKNVENAFKTTDKIVQYRKVILIDDIYTTGATIDSCARVLKDAGIHRVYFITISIGDSF